MALSAWQTILARGQQTVGVWTQFAPAFTVDDLSLAAHEADVTALAPAGQIAEQKQDGVDDMRAARDATVKTISDFSVRMARKLDGDLSPADPFHSDLEDIRTVKLDSLAAALSRGQKTVSLWEKYNARRAAAVPARPALTVGGKTLALYKAEVEALPGRTLAVEKAESVLRDARSDLRAVATRVDVNNKRWYASWSGEFSAGSPERTALGQIDTGSGGGSEAGGGGDGGNGGGPPPGPQAPGTAQIGSVTGGDTPTVTIAFDAEGALTFDIFAQVPGVNEYALHAGAITDHQYIFTEVAGAPWFVYVVGKNAVGDGAPSAPVNFSGPV